MSTHAFQFWNVYSEMIVFSSLHPSAMSQSFRSVERKPSTEDKEGMIVEEVENPLSEAPVSVHDI